ncbi:tyrosine/dopa decarboxylase [Populus alba x Populus x berolinensis]|nr:tyrosine/dopa decarboxylase [Populus alba x Populus x berolinensis]
MFLCATIGTTATTAVDPLRPLCDVANSYGLWVHVDAAYAGNACICPEFQHFLDGIEGAHSFSLNAHKWFFTTLDCCCLWLKDPKALTKSLSTNPEYLMSNHATNSEQVVNYKDWQIALSRRFRSMKLWLVLRSYGVANLRSFLRSHVKMARLFEDLVASDKRFEVVVPRNFAMVCFRALPLATSKEVSENGMADYGRKISYDQECSNQLNQELLKSINASGNVYLTHAVVAGLYIIRFCCRGNAYRGSPCFHGLEGGARAFRCHNRHVAGKIITVGNYGVANLRSFLRSHVKMARLFEDLVASDKRFEVVVPRNFAMVCFRALPLATSKEVSENGMAVYGRKISYDQECSNQLNQELLKSINASGHVYLTHAVVAGLYIIRFAVGATLTEDRHVFTAWKVVQEHLDAITGM